MNTSVGEIADRVGGTVLGDRDARITGVNGIKQAGPGELTFLRGARYRAFLETTHATAVLVPCDFEPVEGKTLIRVAHPDMAFGMVLEFLAQGQRPVPVAGIHPSAVVNADVELGDGASIGPLAVLEAGCRIGPGAVIGAQVYIGRDVVIGAGTVLSPRVVVMDRCQIGARCVLHPGVVIGADGFGFAPIGGVWRKIPQIGTVCIGDDVEIGANTTVDRATFGVTRIGNGTKIDNLVQIGHNVEIGEHCVMAGMSGVAGSAVLGSQVRVGARAGIGGHLEIGDGAQIGALAGVTKSIAAGQVVSGFPAVDHERDKRIQAAQRMAPETMRRVRTLEQKLLAWEESIHGKSVHDS